jgi:hypothetical protein
MPLYRNTVSTEFSLNNNKIVLLTVLLYCYSSTGPGYAINLSTTTALDLGLCNPVSGFNDTFKCQVSGFLFEASNIGEKARG